jgi:dienelactone hydrolase
MKKLILVLALVAVYGIAISNVSAKIIKVEKSQVTVLTDADNLITPEDPPKKKATAKKACCSDKATTKSTCSESVKRSCPDAVKKDCADSAKSCCDDKSKKKK